MKAEKLHQIQNNMSYCTRCGLAGSRNKMVFGGGNPEARIMLVGEAPGYEEDLKGEVFIGRSGLLLDKILAACGFQREEHVYISNVVKCRPPANRKPSPEEIKACNPSLMRQIQIVDPLILVVMGATALNGLISKSLRITKVRGTWTEWMKKKTIPVYHPSALLRNPKLKKDTWSDFQEIFHMYRKLVDPKHTSPHITT